MKRFYKEVAVAEADGGSRVTIDGRPIRTQGGAAQIVPTRALAEALADEWRAQREEIDPKGFVLRDLTDYAIDQVARDPAASIARLLPYAETDTLCYRADPDKPLYRRQQQLWEPLVQAAEARLEVRMERVSGVVHRPQPPETLARLRGVLAALDPFTLAALETLASLAASLSIGLLAIEPDADADALFAAANCEQDWQAEQWGWDSQAEQGRQRRLEVFCEAARFARLSRGALPTIF
jgi:chaperone required for assembly of F1-ATPase